MHLHPSLCRRWTALLTSWTATLLLLSVSLQAQDRPAYFDGPYIFQQNDSLRVKWIERGFPHDTTIARTDATVFSRDSLPVVDLRALDLPAASASTYTGVERIVVISDVHGQYGLMRELLLASGVIDTLDNWALGQGHLVVIGDNFDRGDQVLPILWLFFKLEQQALARGGQVHLLLGNHEVMVLQGDLRYINRKYAYTAGALQTPYPELFAAGSVLGDWIARQQVMVSINRNLFVHAGISPELVDLELSLDELNTIFRERILRQPGDSLTADPLLAFLEGGNGPLWYRGYFREEPLSMSKFKRALRYYDQQRIVVGHTSQEEIQTRYEGRLIVVDCSIKLGQQGQVLLIEGDDLHIIDQEGEQLPLAATGDHPATSIQEALMASATRPRLTLGTDFSRLLRTKANEDYQPAEISLRADGLEYTLTGRVRARGNIRKEVCLLPPLMIDLRKADLDSLGYVRHDKLKLVIPCQPAPNNQTNLYKEFLAYELYRLIDDHGMQTQLVDVEITGPRRQYELTGFLIETEQDYARRTGAMALQSGRASASAVDRQRFVRMMFFQYMIANCDWSVSNKHNLELVKYPDNPRTEFIAYDFDYAGFVGNHYAVPADILPIGSVHERYFFSYPTTEEEIDEAISYFLEREAQCYAICANADYLDPETREDCQEYLRPFFDLLRDPRRFKREIGR
ncbi:MAG: metallophosphoesterase [Lewinella sp.]|nr:metallophosphoesterase [Lewinella sp.]